MVRRLKPISNRQQDPLFLTYILYHISKWSLLYLALHLHHNRKYYADPCHGIFCVRVAEVLSKLRIIFGPFHDLAVFFLLKRSRLDLPWRTEEA
jgi:hypothetical protein